MEDSLTMGAKFNTCLQLDDVNELTDHLHPLMMSNNAGYTAHNNEIVSILGELHTAGVII